MDPIQVFEQAKNTMQEYREQQEILKYLQNMQGNTQDNTGTPHAKCRVVTFHALGRDLALMADHDWGELNSLLVDTAIKYVTERIKQKEIVIGLMSMGLQRALETVNEENQ